jgi:hypothetical protein
MLVVGSQALNKTGPEYLSNAIRQWDWDYMGTYEEMEAFKRELGRVISYPINRGKVMVFRTKTSNYEFEIAWEDSTAAELLSIIKEDNSLVTEADGMFWANPNLLFTLKKSHRYLKDSPHFLKTMIDYNHMLSMGCKVPESLKDWYKKREKDTYWYSHPNLNVSKSEFFKGPEIPYIYDHDTIHLAMMHLDKPAYDYFKPDSKEVLCSKDMFWACDEKIRLYAVLEESYVLALERSQIPAPGAWTPRKSFETALQKVSSSITSGWFRAYAYEHYFEVLNMYDDNYTTKFWQAVDNGIVKKINNHEKQN